jgi:hypothetical protein
MVGRRPPRAAGLGEGACTVGCMAGLWGNSWGGHEENVLAETVG